MSLMDYPATGKGLQVRWEDGVATETDVSQQELVHYGLTEM